MKKVPEKKLLIIELANRFTVDGELDYASLDAAQVEVRLAVDERQQYHDRHEAETVITEDPLSIEVRSDWHAPGEPDLSSEYLILLCTGGPAVRITGELDEHRQPETAELQYQDWFTPWRPYLDMTDEEREALLSYARQFYFGE